MMMAPPQVVGVLLKKPGEQNHSRLSPLDPQDTKIRGELYVEDLNERRIVSVRMGYLWVEGTQMRLPLRALNLRQATSGICQPHVLALGFTLSNSQGDLVATFWADTEPIYWSWVRAIAAELVRQTPFRAQRCLNFLEILTICPRGPVPLPDSPTETRRRSRSELRCWLGDAAASPRTTATSARSARGVVGGVSMIEDARGRRARSELRGWSSGASSDEDLLTLGGGELRGMRAAVAALLPKVDAALAARPWGGCSESSEGSDDSLPWGGAGCRSSVDSIDSAPTSMTIPEPDSRELRIQRYKETRRRENEARSRRVLEEDAKRRKARLEENNNNSSSANNNNNNVNNVGATTATQSERCASRLCDDARNNGNNVETTGNNGRNAMTNGESGRTARSRDRGNNTVITTTTTTSNARDENSSAKRIADAPRDRAANGSRDSSATDSRNNAETTKTTTTPSRAENTTSNGTSDARFLSETARESVKTAREATQSRDRRNNAEAARTTKTTRAVVAENVVAASGQTRTAASTRAAEKLESSSRETTTTTTTTTSNLFVRAAETVDATTRRLPSLRLATDAPSVRFREIDGQEDARNNNNSNKTTGNHNNGNSSARFKADSPPSPGIVRTDSGERRSRARERRNVREKSQQQQPQQPRIPENSLKTHFLQERRERLSQLSRIPIASQDFLRTTTTATTTTSRILDRSSVSESSVERSAATSAITVPRIATFAAVDEDSNSSSLLSSSPCEDEVARLLERCQRVDRYVPVREKLTLFESLSRMGGRLARSTEDLGRASARPSPRGKQRARSLHDLSRAARALPVREMCRLFEAGEPRDFAADQQQQHHRHTRLGGDASNGRIGGKDPPVSSLMLRTNGGKDSPVSMLRTNGGKDSPTSILRTTNGSGSDVPPCVRTSTRRKHYQK